MKCKSKCFKRKGIKVRVGLNQKNNFGFFGDGKKPGWQLLQLAGPKVIENFSREGITKNLTNLHTLLSHENVRKPLNFALKHKMKVVGFGTANIATSAAISQLIFQKVTVFNNSIAIYNSMVQALREVLLENYDPARNYLSQLVFLDSLENRINRELKRYISPDLVERSVEFLFPLLKIKRNSNDILNQYKMSEFSRLSLINRLCHRLGPKVLKDHGYESLL